MSYTNLLSTTIRDEFGQKYFTTKRMTVAKFKRQQKLVKYLERSCPITTKDTMVEVEDSVTVYDICSIDAVKDETGGWMWNDQHHAGSATNEVLTDDILDNSRKVLKWLRDNDYLGDDSKGKVKVAKDDYLVEIQIKSNGKPFLAIHLA